MIEMSSEKVCLVIGAGAGIGATVAKKFARSGYYAILSRRTNQAGLDAAVEDIKKNGAKARGYIINAIEPNSIESLVQEIEGNIGPIEVAVYNLGSQIGNRDLYETTDKVFERG